MKARKNLRASFVAQQGVAMLEVGLALVMVTLLFIMFSPLLRQNTEVAKAKGIALDQTTFQQAAQSYFTANRSAYEAAMTSGTDANKYCLVGVNADGTGGVSTYSATLHRCAFDVSFLRAKKVMPETVSVNNRYGESWVAIFRQIYNTATPPAPTGGYEMLVVSARIDGNASLVPADAMRYSEATTAARYAGGRGGVVPDADRSTCVASRAAGRYEVCGAGFKADLGQFLEANELSGFGSRLSQ